MFERVEREPPLPLGGIIPQQPGRQCVPGLVERDGHQRHQCTDEVIESLCRHVFLQSAK